MNWKMAILLVITCACARSEAPTETVAAPADASATATNEPTDASTAMVDTMVPLAESETRFLESAAVGSAAGPDGMVTTEVTEFKRGQKIVASVRAKEVPAGLVGRAVWLDSRGKEVAQEQKPFPPDTRTITFSPANAPKWRAGEYTVQLWIGGDKVHEAEITITK